MVSRQVNSSFSMDEEFYEKYFKLFLDIVQKDKKFLQDHENLKTKSKKRKSPAIRYVIKRYVNFHMNKKKKEIKKEKKRKRRNNG